MTKDDDRPSVIRPTRRVEVTGGWLDLRARVTREAGRVLVRVNVVAWGGPWFAHLPVRAAVVDLLPAHVVEEMTAAVVAHVEAVAEAVSATTPN